MVGLIDIAPTAETVNVQGTAATVPGVSAIRGRPLLWRRC